ncbi:hypothetical protein QP226_10410, partial [Aerococcus urinae]
TNNTNNTARGASLDVVAPSEEPIQRGFTRVNANLPIPRRQSLFGLVYVLAACPYYRAGRADPFRLRKLIMPTVFGIIR